MHKPEIRQLLSIMYVYYYIFTENEAQQKYELFRIFGNTEGFIMRYRLQICKFVTFTPNNLVPIYNNKHKDTAA